MSTIVPENTMTDSDASESSDSKSVAGIPLSIMVFQPQIFKNIVQHILYGSSLSNVAIVRNIGLVSKHFYKLTREVFPDCYNLILFFKGRFSGAMSNSGHFDCPLSQVPLTDNVWIIPRPKSSKTFSRIVSRQIRFSHFCLESDYEHLKKVVFPRQFPDGRYPKLTDALYEPPPALNPDDPEVIYEQEVIEKIKVRLKRIRQGKIKKVPF